MEFIIIALFCIILFIVMTIVGTALLWGTVRLFREELSFKTAYVTIAIAALLELIPFVGGTLSMIFYYYVLYTRSTINSIFMCILITIIATVETFLLGNELYSVLNNSVQKNLPFQTEPCKF